MANNAPKFQFTTPAGRLVMGSFFDLQKTDFEQKALPEERYHWFVGLAIPKTTTNWWDEPAPLFQAIKQAAQSTYADTMWQSPFFSSKVEDGDTKPREGSAGCWVVKFTRNLWMGDIRAEAPRLGDTQYNPIIDPMVAKKGYYYAISGDCQANGKQGATAGIFVNMSMALLVAQGPEIITGPSLAQAFAGAQFNVPGGAPTPTPVQPVAAPTPAPVAPAPAPVADLRWTPVSPEAVASPDHKAWIAAGWTEQTLIDGGHFTRAM